MTRENAKDKGNYTVVVNIIPMREEKEHKSSWTKVSDPWWLLSLVNGGTAGGWRGLRGLCGTAGDGGGRQDG